MTKQAIYLGEKRAHFDVPTAEGKLIWFENENYYKISNSDAMRPFFMSIVSNSNHWMFISSNGGLSAGRIDSSQALFPYYTDDKITESADITGSKTLLRVQSEGKTKLWEPFSDRYVGIYKTSRNLYKNSHGNKVVFEEVNEDLGLIFRYQWSSSDQFGFVKRSKLINISGESIQATILDGIQNIMPYGVDTGLQATSSNLVDAYKKNELIPDIGLGIYALSAIIVDRAEPSEALKAATVWSHGIEKPKYLASSVQLNNFRKGMTLTQEEDIRAEKGAYFVVASLDLKADSENEWMFVADVNQTSSSIAAIAQQIKTDKHLRNTVLEDVEKGTQQLLELNAAADGLQLTADKLRNTRHFANTLFNIMRGGIFDNNYEIERHDFVKYVEKANSEVYLKKGKFLDQLPDLFSLTKLRILIKELGKSPEDQHLQRLCFEYLPLKFSRRHGDPSRPWNRFSINTKNEDGSKILDYQGNWRDIFQNWEALAHSYPGFMENMIHKFLNATTFDGYNPYRVTKDGFDWETIEADDPWSYIGYWGDHQIIYLLKFLEFNEKHYPGALSRYFDEDLFVYANVPYRIKAYEDILKNPKDTIELDRESEERIWQHRSILGADGALLGSSNSKIYNVNLLEKLLATVLAKMSNFIPEGGIWMNTQRPEWNDANNALVGNGVSMVTLYYLRRFLKFFETIIKDAHLEDNLVSNELLTFFTAITKTLVDHKSLLSGKISNKDRKAVLDALGHAGSNYRIAIYEKGFSGNKTSISKAGLLDFLDVSLAFLEHSIRANQRADKLYHAYNLMTVDKDTEVSVSYLSEMLEGQVAVLSSGFVNGKEALEVLNALKSSALFREDQYSYILYPNKQLARFVEKNVIPSAKAEASALIQRLIKDGNSAIIEKDVTGAYHFNGAFNNADSLRSALSELPLSEYGELVAQDTEYLLAVFEDIFDHKSFTGRSGTFYGYEGLGSIYWHMVSKLLLAVQEVCLHAIDANEKAEVIGGLLDHYYEINEGIGVHKSPDLYGAFPTDPYSHTPGGKGAQQPGMTGQVKEDILCRFGELGVYVSDGCLGFKPSLLRKEEFLKKPMTFEYRPVNGQVKQMELKQGMLSFTYCQVPIVYVLSEQTGLQIESSTGTLRHPETLILDPVTSDKIFQRTKEIDKITVYVNA